MSGAIALRGVTRRFGALVAVDSVDLDVAEGEIVGLLGHNGAGKTTLIRVINGLLSPDAGTVRVGGLDPTTDGHEVRRITGVLTEYPALDEYLTSTENLEVYAAINRIPPAVAGPRIAELHERLDLAGKAHEPTRGLSAGLKQRVALARALVHDPAVLLLDEPTTNMDPVAARTVREHIVDAAHRRGRTVLLSTHNLAEAEQICDRVGIMREGRLLAVGTPAELRATLGGARGARIESREHGADAILAALPHDLVTHAVDHTSVEVAGIDVAVLVARLVAAGVAIHRVEPLEPTLEDLYVRLHDADAAVGATVGSGS